MKSLFLYLKIKLKNSAKKYHIIYLVLFGSILTSKFTKNSDVDVLVRFEKKYISHLFNVIKIEAELTSLIGHLVGLKTPNDLSPYFRDHVLAKAFIIYGK